MKTKRSFETNEELVNKIISIAYRSANVFDTFYVKIIAKREESVRKLLESYEATAEEVHRLTEEEFPEEMLKMVELKNVPVRESNNSFLSDFLSAIFKRPLVSAVTTLILLVAFVTAVMINRPVQYQYSKAEMELADRHTKEAFAIVNKIFSQTRSTLQNEVLSEKVGKPIRDGIVIINNLFNEGGTK